MSYQGLFKIFKEVKRLSTRSQLTALSQHIIFEWHSIISIIQLKIYILTAISKYTTFFIGKQTKTHPTSKYQQKEEQFFCVNHEHIIFLLLRNLRAINTILTTVPCMEILTNEGLFKKSYLLIENTGSKLSLILWDAF